MKPLCIYHANCIDGFTAAWAVWRALGESYDYVAGQYGVAPPNVDGRGVLMVDFSYKRPVLEEIRQAASWVRILDHHKTAIEDLQGLEERDNACPVELIFDIERSGAGIAWDVYCPDDDRPDIVNYVEDRDLWRFRLPNCREVNAVIASFDYNFATWDLLARSLTTELDDVVRCGAAILRKHDKDVAEMVRATRRHMLIGGMTVPVANVPYTMSSDAGNLLAQGHPFAATYVDTAHGRSFSLRSTDAGMDVAEIAKAYGGGGHRNAAGFRVEFDRLPEFGT